MKKRIAAILTLLCISTFVFLNNDISAFAEENPTFIGKEKNIDYSYFTDLPTLYGYAAIPRGVYLASGESAITKINWYTIGVGGTTNAALKCDVSVTAIVERYNLETDRWAFITSWTSSKENAFTAGISKSLVVDSGYYYRVRSLHYAGTDSSSSYTNALYVGK